MISIIKNKWLWGLGSAVVVGVAVFGIFQKLPKTENSPAIFNQEELAKMVKPAVVRIAQKITGKYTIPEFEIDLNTLTTAIKHTRKPEYRPLDEFITGSGFIVSQDGYILTNAHMVSKDMVKALLLNEAFAQNLEEKLEGLSKEEQRKIFQDQEKTEKFANDALALLIDNSQFEIQSSLAVLDPSSQKEKIENLFAAGLPAKIVDLNEKFLFSNKDVGLIKINKTNLPTVDLGEESKINVGSPIFIFGFPVSAQLNSLNPVESTLTQGLISSLKFSENKDFKIFQTDAKISQGSSGGPMFNQKGEVVGIVTYQSSPIYQTIGDNFAFAIPVSLGKDLFDHNHVEIKPNDFGDKTASALASFLQNHCQLASREFSEALTAADPQFVPKNHFENYQKICKERIAQDNSYDSKFDIVWQKIKKFSAFEWLGILGRAILAAAGLVVLFLLYRRLQKDEAELKELETELDETRQELQPQDITASASQIQLPIPGEELHATLRHELSIPHPHLVDYVREARTIGLTDEEIKAELKKAGWSEKEITAAIV